MNTFKISLLLVCIFISGCKQETSTIELPSHLEDLDNLRVFQSGAKPSAGINIIREQEFGDTDDVMISYPGSVEVDDSGRVYISDLPQGRAAIYVFHPDGSHLTTIGGYGEGPGEFRSISSTAIRQNQFIVYDGPLSRISYFSVGDSESGDSDPYSMSHMIIMNPDSWKSIEGLEDAFLFSRHFFVSGKGSVLTSFKSITAEDDHLRFYYIDSEGEVEPDQVLKLEQEEQRVTFSSGEMTGGLILPTSREGVLAMSGDDSIYSASTENFLIKIHSPDGQYQRAFYHPYEKTSLIKSELVRSYEGHPGRNAVRDADLPETWPALNSMLIDDENRLWISTIVDDDEIYEWWVLENSGELISKFNWPRDEAIEEIKNGYLYTRETEEETGLQQIVRYRIEFK
ncbi:MAG: 6-bladed beta-propeller [Balneolaceae bacterium]